MLLDVPYTSQYRDISDPYWKDRGCAVACAKMVLDMTEKEIPTLDALVLECKELYGYDPELGWTHVAISNLMKKYGVSSARKEYKMAGLFETGVQDIKDALRGGNPVMISAVRRWREETKFHMVLFVGFEMEGNEISGFYYHDPDTKEGEEGANLFVSFKTFERYWRRLAIFPRPKVEPRKERMDNGYFSATKNIR